MSLQGSKITQVKRGQFKLFSVVQLDSFFCSLTKKNLDCLKYRKKPVTDNAGRRVITAVYVAK
jgi:hypothetical protein